MPYETNTFASGSGLLQSLATFLTANGWTQDANLDEGPTVGDGLSSGRRVHLSRAGLRANFKWFGGALARYANATATDKNGTFGGGSNYTDYMIGLNVSTGAYQSGDTWDKQGGSGATAAPTVVANALSTLALGVGGSGYLQAPIVVFSGTWTTQPTATATISGGIVTGYTITNAGTGITGTLYAHVVSADHPGTLETASANPSKPVSVELRGNGAVLSGTYHFFVQTSPDTVWIALEVSAGVFRHFGFGTLSKQGSYTGGEWFAGPQSSQAAISSIFKPAFETRITEASVCSFARVSGVDGFTGWLGHVYDSFSRGSNCTGKGLAHGLTDVLGNSFNQFPVFGGYSVNIATNRVGLKYLSRNLLNTQAALLPFYLYCERTKGVDFSLLGTVGSAYYINMQNYTKAQLVTIGANSFRVFPFSVIADSAAGNYFDGIAVKV